MKRITLPLLILFLLPVVPVFAVDDEREPDDTATSSSSRRSTYSSSSSSRGAQSWAYEKPKVYGLSDQARDFLRNPTGLTLVLGFGHYSWYNIGEEHAKYTGTEDIRELFPENAESMWGFRVGFELGKSFVNLRFSPYIGSGALYIEAETGIHLIDPLEMRKSPIFALSTLYFFGTMLSFEDPVIDVSKSNQYSEDDLSHYNNGSGFTSTGIAWSLQLGFRIGPVSVSGGFLASASVVLPDHPLAGLGWLGPNFDVMVIPDSMSVYFEMRPDRGKRHLVASSWEIGTRFYW